MTVDTTAPTVAASTDKADGYYKAGATVNITLTFTENVTLTGTDGLNITLSTGDIINVAAADLAGVTSVTKVYTVGAGDNSGDLAVTSVVLGANAALTDAAGNAASLGSLTANIGDSDAIVIDTTTPSDAQFTATPDDGTYKIGQTLTFAVDFNEAVVVTGTPRLLLSNGSFATYDAASSSLSNGTLSFKYLIVDGQTDAADLTIATNAMDLNSGTIKDLAGNDAVLTLNAGFDAAIVVDANRPTVAISPISGGYINATEDDSDLIISGTTTGAEDGSQVSVTVNGVSSTAIVTNNAWSVTVLAATLQGLTEGTIPVTADISDAAGNAATQASASFVYDKTTPTVTAVTYNSSTNELIVTGTDFTNATFDPSKITWDIDGQGTANPDYTFPGGSAVSILSNTSAKVTLSADTLEGMSGFAGTIEDNLDFTLGFITDLAGNASALTNNLNVGLNLFGTENADNMFGGSLNDLLSGAYGTDELRGNGGADTLIGGGSNDTLIGGSGADKYVFADTLIGQGSLAGDADAFGGINASVGVDTINFVLADGDTFQLNESVFGDMGGAGQLASNQFLSVANISTALTGLNTSGHGAVAYDSTANDLYFVEAGANTSWTIDALVNDGFAIKIADISGNDIASASSFFIV